VALNWMVEQAKLAGVNMNTSLLDPIPVSNPIIHDQSNALNIGDPRTTPQVERKGLYGNPESVDWVSLTAEDRAVHGAVSGATQRTMGFSDYGPNLRSMTTADTYDDLITYFDRDITGNPNDAWKSLTGNQTGVVDIKKYMKWLCANGYFSKESSQCSP
jgi:hypothetical protein